MSLYHVYARLTPAAPDSLVLRIIALAFCLALSLPALSRARLGAARRGRHAARRDRRRAQTTIPWIDLGLAAPLARLHRLPVRLLRVRHQRFPTAHPLSALDIVGGHGGRAPRARGDAAHARASPCPSCALMLRRVRAGSGPWLPGPLRHKGLTYEILIDQTFFTSEGLFGIPLGVAASYVILFIIFGAFLEKSGAGQFFMNFANAIAGGAARRPRQGRGGVVEPVRHDLGLRGRQRHGGRLADHPDDEAHRLQAGGGRRDRGGRLDRRADHAAGDGGGLVRDGGVPRRPVLDHHAGRRHPGAVLLRRPLRGHPLQRRAGAACGESPGQELPLRMRDIMLRAGAPRSSPGRS